jgi:hypothetical protein
MNPNPTRVKSFYAIPVLLIAIGLVTFGSYAVLDQRQAPEKAKSLRKSGAVLTDVVQAGIPGPVQVIPSAIGFSPQVRLGFHEGDQWEPSIAADLSGHIYVLYPQYLGVPGCEECASPAMILQTSFDHGLNWSEPRVVYPEGAIHDQVDAQIVVDPSDGQTVYAAFMQNLKADIVVGKSTDFGETWSFVVANHTKAATDKPWLAVRGQDVYVGYNHAQKVWVSHSHDGGVTFSSTVVNHNGKLGWSLASGGTVTPSGAAHFAWAGYERNGQAKGPVNLYIASSFDSGESWTSQVIDVSGAGPDCSDYLCGWAYLSPQIALASDSSGALYALWNANDTDRSPTRMFFARSEDGATTWSSPVDVSTTPLGVNHTFPAITAGETGDVRIAWMDTRAGVLWNTFLRRSLNGGSTWSSEADLSTFATGFGYIFPEGFSFPFGDYFELDIDERGVTHAVWGEGLNYDTPGSIWYTQGNP